MGAGELALAVASAGFGFIIADGVDRFIATYNPSSTEALPKDKFTSNGNGTLANTLNVSSMPNWKRVVAGVGVTAVPTVGSMFVDNPYARSTLEGMAIGAGVNLLKTLWNNVFMPMLVGKDTSTPVLQKSYIARLYPAEVAAHINKASDQGAPGALSGPSGDVGPFALAGDSPYPDAAEVLRAGVSGDSPYPTAAAALRRESGVQGWQPGPPSSPGPGPQAEPGTDPSCGCVGDPLAGYSSFLGEAPAEN
jgi:hypothetical protein